MKAEVLKIVGQKSHLRLAFFFHYKSMKMSRGNNFLVNCQNFSLKLELVQGIV